MAARRAEPRSAFTLIELLVVIAIIALLVSILMPTLSRAKQLACRAHCAANLHKSGIAVAMYANDSCGYLPVNYRTGGNGYSWTTYWLWELNSQPPREVNLGVVRYEYMAESPDAVFCISQNQNPRSTLSENGPCNLWNDGQGDSIRRLRSSYPARALAYVDSRVAADWKLDDYAGKVIYSDFIAVDNMLAGGVTSGGLFLPHRGEGCNRLFAEGAVRWADMDPIHDLRPVCASLPSDKEVYDYYELLDELP